MTRFLLLCAILSIAMLPASARVVSQTVLYEQGGDTLEGQAFYDTKFGGKRPGVVIFHQWKGPGEYEKRRARMLAEMGYVALVADVYGRGIRPKNAQEARVQATRYRQNRPLMRNRARAAVIALRRHPKTDPTRLAAMGYCFGGGVALELARSGADLDAFASFHGNLDTPDPEMARNIKGRVIAYHGAADPNVPFSQIESFTREMNAANVDWQLISYGNAVHSFTEREAGNDPSDGSAYNEKADKRSWDSFTELLKSEL